MTSVRPRIVAIDDEPDAIRNSLRVGLGDGVDSDALHPRDVELHHLEAADLVLVDFLLTNWPERDSAPLAQRPGYGLSLAGILREQVDASKCERLTAFALHSGHMDAVRGRLPATAGEHVVARLNNLEWVFAKTNAQWDRMTSLATAVQRLPRTWPTADHLAVETEALKLLGLDEDCPWHDRARRGIRLCQPPINDLASGAHGLMFVRWLLHQIMPYPTFLWREEWVAARLRITIETLRKVIEEDGLLAKDLAALQYGGILSGFLGRRWWRSGLEDFVWNVTEGESVNVEALHSALGSKTSVSLEPLPAGAALVCLGTTFEPNGTFISARDAVRLRPDEWPTFADEAWTSIEAARGEPLLAGLVDPLDEERLLLGDSHE